MKKLGLSSEVSKYFALFEIEEYNFGEYCKITLLSYSVL